MEEVLRCTSFVPLAFPCFVLYLIVVETEGLLDYQGQAGIISIVRWNLRLVIFGLNKSFSLALFHSFPQRKTEGEQLTGQNRFGTLSHFCALFHTFSRFFKIFPPGLFFKLRPFKRQ